jgi:chorismate synthase
MLRFLTSGLVMAAAGHPRRLPAGLPLTTADVDADLIRRQQGYGRGGRMSIEKDHVQFAAGVVAGKTTGAPIALLIENRDYKNWADKLIEPMTTPRPGHADLTGALKYGYRDLRLSLERASARETTMRVAVGAVCKRLLAEFGIRVQGYVTAIGDVVADLPPIQADDYPARFDAAEASEVRCPDPAGAERMHAAIHAAIQAKDTLGGLVEVVASAPPGLGSRPLDRSSTGAYGRRRRVAVVPDRTGLRAGAVAAPPFTTDHGQTVDCHR